MTTTEMKVALMTTGDWEPLDFENMTDADILDEYNEQQERDAQ